MLEALQQQTAIALKENVPEQRIKRLMEGTLTALHGGYMSLILRNTSGTYDMAIECNHGEFPEYKPLIQDMPESNLTPRLWDMLYRGSGVIIPDVHQVIDNVKGQWDWEMVSKVDNAILVPFLHTGEVQALLVVCNLTEEACDAYIRFVPLLKAITENMLREFPGDKGFTFLDAEPEKQVEDWKAGLYDTLFYHSDMGIFCKDNNHRYVAANDTFLASYHVTREEILGKTDEELDMHEYPEEVKEEEERILTTGARVLNQVRNITWNGERRTFLVSKLPVWKDGAMQGIIGYSVDITDRGQVGGDGHPLFAARQQQEEAKMAPGNRWKQKYEKSGEDFVCLSIQILRREEFCQLFGEKACHAMKESILRTAGGILPKEAEIIQIYKARFLILISCKTPQAMDIWENRIREVLQPLSWNGKGKSFPLQVMIGAALYSETHAVEDMVALAESRMKADNPQPPEIEKGSIRKCSRQQMEQQLRLYESVFDYVRLVEPKTQTA
ncbi:PAS domain-containing protein, partial [Allisonella histaminiformans]|uniref:PAS domain-containing protein n=1 Tax=Allisonella histaminiformans TaxID=209880 RepID=UPI002357507B